MLLVFPMKFFSQVESLLGHEDVSRLRLPAELGDGTPDTVMGALRQRLATIPQEIKTIDGELAALGAHWREPLTIWRNGLRDELELNTVSTHFGETDMTFIIMGWVPSRDLEKVKSDLREVIGDSVLVHELPITPDLEKRVPIALENPVLVRPFESLVRLQGLPRYGDIDPSALMAFFLPFFFGMMLGDVGYGAVLLALTFGLSRKVKTGTMHDLLTILMMGSGWSILFGFAFGELFGALGGQLGMHALLFDRASPQHLTSLLVMTVGVGAVHITLGLLLGVWEALKNRSRSHLLERGGMLIGLVALFLIVGVLVGFLPKGFMTPAVAVLMIGVVLLGASVGKLGVLVGPIEFIGVIGNVMSYLRIAAIGLASVYLAKVANDMAGLVGNLVIGIIIAVLIHSLNLVLGAFSPTIHSLRLHYVEFFRKFHEGGGRPYEPFRSQLQRGANFDHF
jgi:V/A-type H+-transporting ATPase subunit I